MRDYRYAERLKLIQRECGFKYEELSLIFNASPATIYAWCKGETVPNLAGRDAIDGLIERLSPMRCGLEGKKAFAREYLKGFSDIRAATR